MLKNYQIWRIPPSPSLSFPPPFNEEEREGGRGPLKYLQQRGTKKWAHLPPSFFFCTLRRRKKKVPPHTMLVVVGLFPPAGLAYMDAVSKTFPVLALLFPSSSSVAASGWFERFFGCLMLWRWVYFRDSWPGFAAVEVKKEKIKIKICMVFLSYIKSKFRKNSRCRKGVFVKSKYTRLRDLGLLLSRGEREKAKKFDFAGILRKKEEET